MKQIYTQTEPTITENRVQWVELIQATNIQTVTVHFSTQLVCKAIGTPRDRPYLRHPWGSLQREACWAPTPPSLSPLSMFILRSHGRVGVILSKEALGLVGHMMVASLCLESFLTGHSLPSILPEPILFFTCKYYLLTAHSKVKGSLLSEVTRLNSTGRQATRRQMDAAGKSSLSFALLATCCPSLLLLLCTVCFVALPPFSVTALPSSSAGCDHTVLTAPPGPVPSTELIFRASTEVTLLNWTPCLPLFILEVNHLSGTPRWLVSQNKPHSVLLGMS